MTQALQNRTTSAEVLLRQQKINSTGMEVKHGLIRVTGIENFGDQGGGDH